MFNRVKLSPQTALTPTTARVGWLTKRTKLSPRHLFIGVLLSELAIATAAGAIDPVAGFTADASMVLLHVVVERRDRETK